MKQIRIRILHISILVIPVLFPLSLQAQVQRVGAGLTFGSGYEYNSSEMGNPGLKLKTWITVDRKDNFHIVPSVTAFNRSVLEAGYYNVNNYLFMGDVDVQYTVYRERTLKTVIFLGGNLSYLNSVVVQTDPDYPIPEYAPGSTSEYSPGGSVGAGLELRMAAQFDMNVSGRYILSKYPQFIISVEGVYYFKKRRRSYRR